MPLKRKVSMTVFDVAAIVSWLERRLLGARLVNVYLVDNVYLLRFKSSTGDYRVAAEPGKRIHPTFFDVAEKSMPPPLVMAIRKRIRNAVLKTVSLVGFDRIVRLGFSNGYELVIEAVPRGVVALLDNNGRIVVASEYREMRDRIIRPGEVYKPPPQSAVAPENLEPRILVERVKASGRRDAARALVLGLGYPGEVVEEALLRAGLKPDTSIEIVVKEAEKVVEELKNIYREVKSAEKVYIVYSGGEPITVVAFNPRGIVEEYGYEARELDVVEGFDKYYVESMRRRAAEQASAALEAERVKIEKSIREVEERIRELSEKKKRLEILAEKVSLNISEVYSILDCARSVHRRAGWDYILGSCRGVVDVDPSRGMLKIVVGDELLEISINTEPQRLVVDLYKRIGELESKIERAKKALEELRRRLNKLEEEVEKAEAKAYARIRRKRWYEKFHWMVTSGGFLVIAGRDASQNETIVRKYLSENDIFLHADIHGAAAVVLKTEGREPSQKDIIEAAKLAAAYSKAWKAGLAAVDVFWVRGSQVSKTPPSGEYLAHGAIMVYGKKNYVKGVEIRLGIGIAVDDEGSPHVIMGPPDLVKTRSIVYAVLIPGRQDPSKTASLVKKKMASIAPQEFKPIVDAITVEEIRQHIPGPSEIVEVGLGDAARRNRAGEDGEKD